MFHQRMQSISMHRQESNSWLSQSRIYTWRRHTLYDRKSGRSYFVWPQNPEDDEDQFKMESWKKKLDIYWKRWGIYSDNKMKLYSLIRDQSTKTTQSKLETHQDFSQCKVEYDTLNWWNSSESLFSRAMISSIYTSRQGIKPRENSITCTRLQNGVAKNTLKGWRILLNYKKSWGVPVWWYALKRWTMCKT